LNVIPSKSMPPVAFPSFAHTHVIARGTISIQATEYYYGIENLINE